MGSGTLFKSFVRHTSMVQVGRLARRGVPCCCWGFGGVLCGTCVTGGLLAARLVCTQKAKALECTPIARPANGPASQPASKTGQPASRPAGQRPQPIPSALGPPQDLRRQISRVRRRGPANASESVLLRSLEVGGAGEPIGGTA
jgi:hypothetical protein